MSKIICEVCGTSYADTTMQCPVCGCVGSGENQSGDNGGYTYVKGGRFSKSNVRKRAAAAAVATPKSGSGKNAPKKNGATYQSGSNKNSNDYKNGSSNKGLVITAVVLLLLIIVVVAFIVIMLLQPNKTNDKNQDPGTKKPGSVVVDGTDHSEQTQTQDEVTAPEETEPTETEPEETQPEETEPEETEPVEEFRLLTYQKNDLEVGLTHRIYSGTLTGIVWTSADKSVATVQNGVVTAVGPGTTTVYGEYNGEKLSCTITVVEEADDDYQGMEGTGGVSSDEGSDDQQQGENKGFYFVSNFSNGNVVEDVSLWANKDEVSKTVELTLMDASGKPVTGTVEWKFSAEGVCTVSDGKVVACISNNGEETYVIAIYDGVEYKCIVRVW